jgi:hypothetical protein
MATDYLASSPGARGTSATAAGKEVGGMRTAIEIEPPTSDFEQRHQYQRQDTCVG